MAYYFMVETKKGQYEPIEINKSKYFKGEKKQYVKPYAYGLNEVDAYTTCFIDKDDLRATLLEEGLLNPEYQNKALSIRFYNKNQYNKVRHDFLFYEDLKYIKNPDLIVDFVMEKYDKNDFLFLKKLAANFSRHHECANTATEVMHAAEHSLYNNKRHEILEIFDLNGNLLVTRLIKLLIYKHTTDYSGYIRYKDEVNYKNLHDVIAYINNYFRDKTEKETKPKTKIKTKKPEVEGQISIFD